MPSDAEHHTAPAPDYRARAAAIQTLVTGASSQEWSAPSPCEEWDAGDVLRHMVHTQCDFLSGHDLDPGSPPGSAEPEVLWREHTAHVASLLDEPRTSDREYDGFFGRTTIGETMAQFYGWDMLVHRWDIGIAMSRDPGLSDVELDEIERALPLFGEALYSPGICAPAVEVGPLASRTQRVMARLGREPGAAE
ncbi:MAG: maleylpyruvate isomerase family mycothiol-dependent enzyme [Ornithinimicrobium sp.]